MHSSKFLLQMWMSARVTRARMGVLVWIRWEDICVAVHSISPGRPVKDVRDCSLCRTSTLHYYLQLLYAIIYAAYMYPWMNEYCKPRLTVIYL